MGKKDAGTTAVYSTKLYEGTIRQIKALAQAGKVIRGGFGERQLIEEMLEAYLRARPDMKEQADRYLAAIADVKANQPDAPIAVSKRGVIKISQPMDGYKVEKGVS